MTKTKRTITLNDIEALRLTFSIRGREHDYNRDPEKRYDRIQCGIVTDINADYGSGRWFAFWIEDCFDPCIYVIQQETFEAAYEDFCDWQADQLRIDEADLIGRDENFMNYTSNGTPIDTEAVQGCECHLVRIDCA